MVFRELEQEVGVPIRPGIRVQGPNANVTFDGAFRKSGRFTGVEVVFAQALESQRIEKLLDLCRQAVAIGMDVIIAVVLDDERTTISRGMVNRLSERVDEIGINVSVQVYRLAELRHKYGLDADVQWRTGGLHRPGHPGTL